MNAMNGMEIYSDMLIDMMLHICRIKICLYISKKFHSYIKNRNCQTIPHHMLAMCSFAVMNIFTILIQSRFNYKVKYNLIGE